MSTYRTGSSHNTHWAASTNLGTLKSCLNMKTASIEHFNFRAKWHQQNLCGEASVKPKSWVPHRFPTINTCPGHNQGDHSRGDYVVDLEFQKSHTKIIFPCFLCAIKHLKGLMLEAFYNLLDITQKAWNSEHVFVEPMWGAIWLVTGPLHYGRPKEI